MKATVPFCLALLAIACSTSETPPPLSAPVATCAPQSCPVLADQKCHWVQNGCGDFRMCGTCTYRSCPNGIGLDLDGVPIPCDGDIAMSPSGEAFASQP